MKQGRLHVVPPFEVLAGMVTLRVHLDDVPADNGPLLVARGSHRLGRVAASDMAAAIAGCPVWTCLARAGDIWRYATPILHASAAAERPTRRRVLQLDYAATDLPGRLRWARL